MSDIHEELELFKEMLRLVDLSEDKQLILLGDFIDIHSQDLSILYFIKELQVKHNLIMVAGNHEYMLIEDNSVDDPALIKWLKALPYYYETPYNQICCHAGIDEEAPLDLWKYAVEDYYFCSKYPHTTGNFFKDIIAGHVPTSQITGKVNYHKVYWDKQSHFYIDGDTRISKKIPLLKYDIHSEIYSSFKKIKQDDGNFVWEEYVIKKRK